MNLQCVPSWDLDDHPNLTLAPPHYSNSNSNSLAPHVPSLEYEVAELTWENGNLSMHGLGPPRVPNNKSMAAASWDKPSAAGTLESIVNQATTYSLPHNCKSAVESGGDDVVPWFDHQYSAMVKPAAYPSVTMDALVPCSTNNNNNNNNNNNEPTAARVLGSVPEIGTCTESYSASAGSCSGDEIRGGKLARVEIGDAHMWSSKSDQSMSDSGMCRGGESLMTLDTCEKELGTKGFTSTSSGSSENTSFTKQCTDTSYKHESVSHDKLQWETSDKEKRKRNGSGKSSFPTKRSRVAAIHNQSERKRRDKINQRIKTLQKLVPNSIKVDKASMLDEVIEYLKQLQAQVQMMNRMNMMMMPLAMQQQLLQMSMMSQMGMGMGIGMGMGMPPLLPPNAFMPMPSWDIPRDRLAMPAPSLLQDPSSAFFSQKLQMQRIGMEGYSRMAALYQQFQPPPGPPSRN